MSYFYEVRAKGQRPRDISDYDDAVYEIEDAGSGSFVKFRRELNVEGRSPLMVEKSCGSACFENGEWRGSLAPKRNYYGHK